MDCRINLPFNPKPPTIMHIDLNSCFASIEQQANPLLRGKPIAVAAYQTPNGCILAPSIEAKRLGIKVGMRVKECKLIYPNLQVLSPDPWKYRHVHLRLREIIGEYTDKFSPKSIDEFVLNLEGYPAFKKGMVAVGREIKEKIIKHIGDWLRVSIGIGPNRFLAKQAAGLKKPDGLEEINAINYEEIYSRLTLTDLNGIKKANASRLNLTGIYTVMDLYRAGIPNLKAAFRSIAGYYWHLRLHGWEIDDVEFGRKSLGAMYSLPRPLVQAQEIAPILCKLVEKAGFRMRRSGFMAKGVHVAILYRDHCFWHHGKTQTDSLFDSRDIYKKAFKIMSASPYTKPVANLAVSVFNLEKVKSTQLDLFGNNRKTSLVSALDKINSRWGDFVITPAIMMGMQDKVPDRIGFGNIKDLEQFVIGNTSR